MYQASFSGGDRLTRVCEVPDASPGSCNVRVETPCWAGTADLRHDCLCSPVPRLSQPQQQHRGSVLWWRSCGNSPDLGIRRHRREPWPCSAAWNCRHCPGRSPQRYSQPCSLWLWQGSLAAGGFGESFVLADKRERLGYHCSFSHSSFFLSFE